MKLTPWYPGTVKPVRKGVYKRQFGSHVFYCRWNGRRWNVFDTTVDGALRETAASSQQSLRWRGVAK